MIIIITIRLTSGSCLRSSSSAALSLTCLLKPARQHVWHPLHQRHIWTLLSWKKTRADTYRFITFHPSTPVTQRGPRQDNVEHSSPTVIYKTTIFIFMLEFYVTGRKWSYCSFGEIRAQSVPVTWAPTSGVAPTGRSYRPSLSHSQGELGVLCQTSHLLDGGASLEAAWAEETHTHTHSQSKIAPLSLLSVNAPHPPLLAARPRLPSLSKPFSLEQQAETQIEGGGGS